MNFKRKSHYETLRGYQTLISEVRERTAKAISFAKVLRRDLEVSAEFRLTESLGEVLKRLQETDHVQVIAPHSEQHLVFVPRSSAKNQESVLKLLEMKIETNDQRSANIGGHVK